MFDAELDLSTIDSAIGYVIDGVYASDFLGYSAASAGDFNNDGIDDIILGAPGVGLNQGAAYVVFGTVNGPAGADFDLSTLNGRNGIKISGPSVYDLAGITVASAGDFNGDGIDDVIVGAPQAEGDLFHSGASYVIYGRDGGYDRETVYLNSLSTTSGFEIIGEGAAYGSGRSVSGIGDFNGDGYDDVVVGARDADRNGTDSGAAYVVYGRASGVGVSSTSLALLTGANGFKIYGKTEGDAAGFSVGSAGDINGDGHPDLIIGAMLRDSDGEASGASYVLFGGPGARPSTVSLNSLNGANGFGIMGQNELDFAGASVGAAGDVDGDGIDDLIIGAANGGPGEFAGRSYVVYGRTTGFSHTLDLDDLNGSNGYFINGAADDDYAGFTVAGAGDVNHDGYDDVVIGAFGADANGTDSGAAYVVFGTADRGFLNVSLSSLNGENGFVLNGETSADYVGSAVGSAGDVNGDGVDDLIIGGVEASGPLDRAGRVYVIYGRGPEIPLDAADDAFFLTENVIQYGNVMDDNGAGEDIGSGTRAIYAIDGLTGNVGQTLSLGSGATLRVDADGTFNYDATTALDHLRDGETVVETVRYTLWAGKGEDTGPASVLLSEVASGDGSTGFALRGAVALDAAGRAVAGAGDVNGDGIDDFIVGAPRADANGESSGTSYLVFGTAGGPGVGSLDLASLGADDGVAIHGALADDRSGDAVAAAGDVNGDGIDDLIIGAWGGDEGGTLSGASYVVYGAKGGFGVATLDLGALTSDDGFALIGASSVDYSGRSVSGAGDVNGDGIDDLIVGAPDGAPSGASYVVFGTAGPRADVDLGALTGVDGFALIGAGDGDASGALVSGAGDVNGDGIDDLLVGSYGADVGGTNSGAVHVVYGQAGPRGATFDLADINGANGFLIHGASGYDDAGRGASAAGDVNGDGKADLIIGAQTADAGGADSGESYVIYGGFAGSVLNLASKNAKIGFRIEGAAAGDLSGRSVDGAGDVNGDGYDDLLIGARGAGDAGAAYVVFGSAYGPKGGTVQLAKLTGADGFVIEGVSDGALTGYSVAGAGDVNADGFADLLVGAQNEGPNGSAFVVFGRDAFTPVADEAVITFTVTGIEDAPVTYDDNFIIAPGEKLSGSVLVDNGDGADHDPEGADLTVIEIEGVSVTDPGPVTLASGAIATLRADGTFDYDPNGVFDHLSPGEEAQDSFRYVVSDGGLSTSGYAIITVDGGNVAPGILSPDAFLTAEGQTAVATLSAVDADGDPFTWRITGGEDADLFAIDDDGDLSFIKPPAFRSPADAGRDGVYQLRVEASDGVDATAHDIAVTVAEVNSAVIGEVAHLSVGTSWQTLTFANAYVNPVVFALSPTLNEIDAAATRFRNVTGTGAEILLQEPRRVLGEANASGHVNEDVTLLVMERGIHTLEDGTVIQVGEIETNKLYVKGFTDAFFHDRFDEKPVVFSQVQTFEGTDWVVARQDGVGNGRFRLTMQEEQADNLNHAWETVGWFAIEGGSGTLGGIDWQAGSSAQNVNGKLTDVQFNEAFDDAPLVVATIATYAGTDPASSRIGSVSNDGFTAMVLEDRSLDAETQHGYEQIDWMAFSGEGTLYNGPAPAVRIMETGFAEVGDTVVTVSFGSHFDDPVVIASLSIDGGAASLARISGVTGDGFDLRLQAADGHDGALTPASVSWMVVEAGSWTLLDGTRIEAGTVDTDQVARHGFDAVVFDDGFAAGPAVLTQTQTDNDAAFVKTRMQGVDGDGFSVALEEAEAASWGAHGRETVGWIAMDQGAAENGGALAFAAGTARANHGWAAVDFDDGFDFAQAPAVMAGIASYNANDAANAAIASVDAGGFDLRVAEDRSLNAETGHATEEFHWVAFDTTQDLWGTALI